MGIWPEGFKVGATYISVLSSLFVSPFSEPTDFLGAVGTYLLNGFISMEAHDHELLERS